MFNYISKRTYYKCSVCFTVLLLLINFPDSDWASCFKSGQIQFIHLHSLFIVRLHVSQGLAGSRRGFSQYHREDYIAQLVGPLKTHLFAGYAQIQPHLCLLMIISICSISVIFNRFILDIAGKANKQIAFDRSIAKQCLVDHSLILFILKINK